MAARRRRATARSTPSPVLWPYASLMRLKKSTSMSATALEASSLTARESSRSAEVATVEEPGQRIHARQPLETPEILDALLLRHVLRRDVAGGSAQEHASSDDGDARPVQHPAGDTVVSDEAVALLDDLTVRLDEQGVAPLAVEARAIVGVHASGDRDVRIVGLVSDAEQRRRCRGRSRA